MAFSEFNNFPIDKSRRLKYGAPSIPVRYNRRFTLKHLSELNGENLTLVMRNLLGSDQSVSTKGMISAQHRKLNKMLISDFRNHKWDLERYRRLQNELYSKLVQYHFDQRTSQRNLMQKDKASQEELLKIQKVQVDNIFAIILY